VAESHWNASPKSSLAVPINGDLKLIDPPARRRSVVCCVQLSVETAPAPRRSGRVIDQEVRGAQALAALSVLRTTIRFQFDGVRGDQPAAEWCPPSVNRRDAVMPRSHKPVRPGDPCDLELAEFYSENGSRAGAHQHGSSPRTEVHPALERGSPAGLPPRAGQPCTVRPGCSMASGMAVSRAGPSLAPELRADQSSTWWADSCPGVLCC